MPLEWSGATPELLLTVARDSQEPLRGQVERQIREAIRIGRLDVGERLPSTRVLATALGLSRGLVQECFAQLIAEGYLVSRVGDGTRVASGVCGPPSPPEPPTREVRLLADFRAGVPDLRGFPMSDWLWAQREAARDLPTADLDYGDPRGSEVLRTVLAGYLRRVRAALTDPARIVVCAGYAQGLRLALHALARRGVRVLAFEDPGAPESSSAAAAEFGMTTVAVPVDEDGIDVAALAETTARAVIVSPAHQWPTGVVLAPARRLALLDWAREVDGFVIEDDYDAEFRYDREPVGAVQGLDADRVITIGTVSKSLVPALRIGWLLCPAGLAEPITEVKHRIDRGSPTLDQVALALLISSGRYDRHLRRMRATYATRRTALVDALTRHAPDLRLTGMVAGFHAVAHVEHADEQELIDAALARSVGLYGMSECRADHSRTPTRLVLGFGNTTDRAITEGIAAIADLLNP
ncbi:MAG TPA: PLP-dependent aminotransferase family protein [Pseudonocardiaceae bacterium]|jgi:GntR family transcriptional regulator/MocR family aminotransferase|nr:PLP-dependent aminotransferase family protein [Pseudonocardiaceae bacterium]